MPNPKRVWFSTPPSRDMEGLSEIEGFNAFVRGWHPSFLTEVMLLSINDPIRIGAASVMPGDVVLAKKEGVIFIPAHLAEKVVVTSEVVRLRDLFGITRLKEGKIHPGTNRQQMVARNRKRFF